MRNIKLKLIISLLVMTFGIILLSNTCNASPAKSGTIQVDEYLYYGTGEYIADTEIGTNKEPVKGVTYDPSSNTLTLNNYTGKNILLYRVGNDFKIELIGTNSISASWLALSTPMAGGGDDFDTEVGYPTDVTFIGNGILNINGYVCLDNVTINGPTITITNLDTALAIEENLNFIKGKLEVISSSTESDIEAISCSGKITCSEGTDYDNTYKKHIIMEKVIKDVSVTDTTTGTKLTTTTESIPEDVKLVVNKVSNDNVAYILSDKVNNFKTYDIYLEVNDEKVQPTGKVKISLLIPEGIDTTNLVVYYVDGDNLVEYEVEIEKIGDNYYATFETDHFSTYVLAEKKVKFTENNTNNSNKQETSNQEKDDTPKTGNVNYLYLAIIVATISSFMIIFRKKQK